MVRETSVDSWELRMNTLTWPLESGLYFKSHLCHLQTREQSALCLHVRDLDWAWNGVFRMLLRIGGDYIWSYSSASQSWFQDPELTQPNGYEIFQ